MSPYSILINYNKVHQCQVIENLKFVLKSIRDSGTLDSDVLERLNQSE